MHYGIFFFWIWNCLIRYSIAHVGYIADLGNWFVLLIAMRVYPFALKPNWWGLRILFISMKSLSRTYIIFSRILERKRRIDKKDAFVCLFVLFLFVFLFGLFVCLFVCFFFCFVFGFFFFLFLSLFFVFFVFVLFLFFICFVCLFVFCFVFLFLFFVF